MKRRSLLLIVLLSLLWLVLDRQAPAATAPFAGRLPKRASSAIALTTDGATLLVVNPDSNSMTLVDTASQQRLAEIPVGMDPRTVAVEDAGRHAYVANRGSNSVSVVDLAIGTVVAEIGVGARPYGVLASPEADRLYVAEQGADQVRILDTDNFATVAVLPAADRPSGLALSSDGRTLYVTHLLTNTITVITVRPYLVQLPLIIASAMEPGLRNPQLAVNHPAAPPETIPQSAISLWPDSNLVQAIVLSPAGRRAYVPHTRSNTGNRALTFDTTVFPLVSVVDLTTQQHLTGQQFDLGVLDPPGVGQPFDAAVTPDAAELWVVNAASNDISVISLTTRQLVAHIEVGDNPRGIVLSPDGARAYVNNALAGAVSVVDTAAYTVTALIPVTDIPLPPALLRGKRLFHTSDDPRMSRAQWIACNSCHFDGEHDGRTWTFGFAGPRNTTSLLGMVQTYPLRWSGEWDESADSEFAIRRENFGAGLASQMNCALFPPDCVSQPPDQGQSYDLDALALFLDSLEAPRSPYPPDAAVRRGQAVFSRPASGCFTCHPPPLYTDQQKHAVGTATTDERIGPAYDTPTLLGLYNSAPYFHDGSAATLYATLTRPTPGNEHDVRGLLTEQEITDLIAFLEALPFE